jgi:inorganic pyrophosphatase
VDAEKDLFWLKLDQLVASSRLCIDRPKGTAHPRYPELVYPYDYGYLEGTQGGDGHGIDVWVGSLPARAVMGVICTVDLHKRDAELKILLGCTPEEAAGMLKIHQGGSMGAILTLRPGT